MANHITKTQLLLQVLEVLEVLELEGARRRPPIQ
jgi:hypothetical protein